MLTLQNTKGHYLLMLAGQIRLVKAVVERSWTPSFFSWFGCSRGKPQWNVRIIAEMGDRDGAATGLHEHIIEADSFEDACNMVDQVYTEHGSSFFTGVESSTEADDVEAEVDALVAEATDAAPEPAAASAASSLPPSGPQQAASGLQTRTEHMDWDDSSDDDDDSVSDDSSDDESDQSTSELSMARVVAATA